MAQSMEKRRDMVLSALGCHKQKVGKTLDVWLRDFDYMLYCMR